MSDSLIKNQGSVFLFSLPFFSILLFFFFFFRVAQQSIVTLICIDQFFPLEELGLQYTSLHIEQFIFPHVISIKPLRSECCLDFFCSATYKLGAQTELALQVPSLLRGAEHLQRVIPSNCLRHLIQTSMTHCTHALPAARITDET